MSTAREICSNCRNLAISSRKVLAPSISSIDLGQVCPILFRIPFHRRRLGVLGLEPVGQAAGPVTQSEALRNNPLQPPSCRPAGKRLRLPGAPSVRLGGHLAGSYEGFSTALPFEPRSAPCASPCRSTPTGRRRTGTPRARFVCGEVAGRKPRLCRRSTPPRHRSSRTAP